MSEAAKAAAGARTAKGPASRRVALAGVDIDYRLLRGRRRTIGMEVDLEGLTVRAPRWVTIREIEEALHERARWILRALEQWRGRRRDVLPQAWRTGGRLLYGGRDLALAVFPAPEAGLRADLFNLTVLHPSPDNERAIADAVLGWLRAEAARLVAPRVTHHAAKLGRTTPPVRLSNARGEWGSCNCRGEIRLNWRLVQLPPELAEYVVAHEVAHLVELNHSPRFWSVVESLLPGHAARRRELGDWTALLVA